MTTITEPEGEDVSEATARPWRATTIGSHDQKHAAAKAFLAVMATRAEDNPDIQFSDTTWIRNADDTLEVAFVGNGPKQTENATLIVTAVNAYDRLRAIEAAAREVWATLTPVPPGAGRMGFLVAPRQGRAFELAAANLVAALHASEVPSDAR